MNRRPRLPACCAALVAGAALSVSLPATAQEDDRVYEYETPPESNLELLWLDVAVLKSDLHEQRFGEETKREGLQLSAFEAEYGVTDRWSVAAYGDFEAGPGGPLRYRGVRVETRYRLFEPRVRWFDTSLSAELVLPRPSSGEGQTLDTRVVLQRDIEDFRVIANPIFELALSGEHTGEGIELGAAVGVYYRRFAVVQPAVEYFASFGRVARPHEANEQRHVIYPTVQFWLAPRLSLLVSVGFGLTAASDDISGRGLLSYTFETVRPSERAF